MNYARNPLLHFLMRLTHKWEICSKPLIVASKKSGNFLETLDRGFQEVFIRWNNNTLEGIHFKGLSMGNDGKIKLQIPYLVVHHVNYQI
jgi:hypothetical protein